MDLDIIKLLQEGNEEGLRLLQSRYGKLLRYMVFHILRSEEETEECLGDIYLKIWEKFSQFNGGRGDLLPWATAVARNTALNRLRRNNPVWRELKEDDASVSSPEDTLLKKERNASLVSAIQKLSADERNLFLRKYYYLQSTEQIGAELNLSGRAVEGRLYRLRKKLQNMVGGEMDE